MDSATRILASLLESRTGQQLGINRRWRIETALKGLMRERGLASLDQLVAAIVADREIGLAETAVEALLNNETYFFRDRTPFDILLGPALARLEAARASEKRLSIWCAACSTGQEAYSLAMEFAGQPERWRGWTIEVVGTDISRSAIARARAGLYSQFEVQRGLPVTHMMRWFGEAPGQQWRIAESLRTAVRFEVRDLADAPPRPGRFDIILCRNALLYFALPVRRRILARLVEASRSDTMLMLGAGETVIGQTEAFQSDPDHRGLYRRSAEPERVRRFG